MKKNKVFDKLSSYFNIHIYFMIVITAFTIDHLVNIIENDTYYTRESLTIIIITAVVILINFKLYLVLITNRTKNMEIINELENNNYNDTDIEKLYDSFSLEIKLVWGSLLIFLIFIIFFMIYLFSQAASY